jgi:hypothetical protein
MRIGQKIKKNIQFIFPHGKTPTLIYINKEPQM